MNSDQFKNFAQDLRANIENLVRIANEVGFFQTCLDSDDYKCCGHLREAVYLRTIERVSEVFKQTTAELTSINIQKHPDVAGESLQ